MAGTVTTGTVLRAAFLLLACMTSGVSAAGAQEFQLVGSVLREDGRPFRDCVPVVFLHGAVTPFAAQTQAAADGGFRFKKLALGTYILTVALPGAGETRKTLEIGPSFADNKGRVAVKLNVASSGRAAETEVVSAAELAIPPDALQEYGKAQESLSRRDIDKAIACLKKAVALAPQYAAAWNNLGTIAYQSRNYSEAESYFRESLKQHPRGFSALVNLGAALVAQGKYEESLTVNRQAAGMRPDDALAQSQLGSSYYFLGRLEEAEDYLKRAKALDPGHFSLPQIYLVDIYLRRNNTQSARSEIEEFLRLHPDSPLAPKMRAALEKLQ